MSLRTLIFITFTVVISTLSLNAQKGIEVGGWAGTSLYYGDLNTTLQIKEPGLGAGIFAKRNFNTRVSLRGGLNFGRIGGDDAKSDNAFQNGRNLNFKTNIWDLTGGIEFNFLEYEHGSSDQWYTPYVFLGMSIFHYSPTTELDGTRYKLRNFGTEGQEIGNEYGSISGSFTLGGGLKWDYSRDISFFVELTTHRAFTDYLDDVSTVYPDFNALEDRRGAIAVALSNRSNVDGIGISGRQRGNSRDNDTYIFFGVGVSRYFGRIECPTISDWK